LIIKDLFHLLNYYLLIDPLYKNVLIKFLKSLEKSKKKFLKLNLENYNELK